MARAAEVTQVLHRWVYQTRSAAEALSWCDLLAVLVHVGDEAGLFTADQRENLNKRLAQAVRQRQRRLNPNSWFPRPKATAP